MKTICDCSAQKENHGICNCRVDPVNKPEIKPLEPNYSRLRPYRPDENQGCIIIPLVGLGGLIILLLSL